MYVEISVLPYVRGHVVLHNTYINVSMFVVAGTAGQGVRAGRTLGGGRHGAPRVQRDRGEYTETLVFSTTINSTLTNIYLCVCLSGCRLLVFLREYKQYFIISVGEKKVALIERDRCVLYSRRLFALDCQNGGQLYFRYKF